MTPSTQLFDLIKSLSMSEKRYFKLCSDLQSGDKGYLKLFDAIEQQEVYDEASIKKLLRKEHFTKQLPFTKNYLHRLILKAMRQYHTQESTERIIKEQINDIKFLYSKGLYDQCSSLLKRTKELAIKYEKQLLLIELYYLETDLMAVGSFANSTKNKIEEHFAKLLNKIKKFENSTQYRRLSFLIHLPIIKAGMPRKTIELESYEKILKNPLLKSEKNAKSTLALSYYYHCYSTYYFLKNDFSNAYIFSKKLISQLESQMHIIEENPTGYISVLHGLIACVMNLKKYSELPDIIKKSRSINTKSVAIKDRIYVSSLNQELYYYSTIGQFEKGLGIIKNFLTDQRKENRRIISKESGIFLNYFVALIYFGNEDYAKANKFLNKIINDPEANHDVRSDIYCIAKILSLIVHYEMNNLMLLEYVSKSVYRYLLTKEKLYKGEQLILEFIRKKFPKIQTGNDLAKALKELHTGFSKLVNDPFEKKVFEYFDFLSWLESKIEKRSFAQIVREKASIYLRENSKRS